MDIWSWICELPNSDEWTESNSPFVYQLATSKPTPSKINNNNNKNNNSLQSIQLRAEPTFVSISETYVKFSICLLGFKSEDITLWVSDTCHLSSDKPFLPFIMQILQEIISRSPTAHDSTCPRSQLPNLNPEPIAWILDSHSPESFSSFFNLIFLTRLFWLCAWDAPPDAGSLYFNSLLAPNLDTFSCKHAPVLRTFFVSVGTDIELCFMRTFGYILAKWLILRDVGLGLKTLTPSSTYNLGFSYAMESHGLWVMKAYTPLKAMKHTTFSGQKKQSCVIEAKESVIKYALAHQQLEAVIQFEYTVGFCDGYIQVNTRVDNIRLHVVKLGFNKNEEDNFLDERYFPSRIRVWVGPEIGASYVGGLSLGRSTNNVVREVETQKILKGNFGTKVPEVRAMAKMSTRTKMKNWRWDQDAEGNAATFDGILYDNTTGIEVATWDHVANNNGGDQLVNSFRRRYNGASRVFTKKGGLIFAGEECGEGVGWRLSKDMEGSVLKWRIGGQVWLTYLPNDVNSSYHETRCAEWCDEIDLPLIPNNN